MNELFQCGLMITQEGDIVDILAMERGSAWELFYYNEPYGVISIYGYNEFKIIPLEKSVSQKTETGLVSSVNPTFINIYEMLKTQSRCKAHGVVLLDNKELLFITDIDSGDGEIQPFRLGSEPNRPVVNMADVADVDETLSDFSEVMDALISR